MDQVIKEVIVVEGRDDIDAVQRAVDADIIATHGYGISDATLRRIRSAYETRGIIILTDPDHAGNRIRKRLTDMFPGAKQAYISRNEATCRDDIGVENAEPDVIRRAIETAGRTLTNRSQIFDESDMVYYGLSGGPDSKIRRDKLGRRIGIGYGNAKAFLKRLNYSGISREELENILLAGDEKKD